jgi:CheY-like chemotaxis protein
MAMFGSRKAKPSESSELVLAYLEEAQRVRANCSVLDPKGRDIQASLIAVTEERVTLSIQGPVMAEKGEAISLFFFLDGLRFKAKSRLVEAKPGTLIVDLPASLELADRRKKPRARLNPREGATALALTGLFDGVGIVGIVENISETGACIRVEKAMDVKTQRKMHMGANLVAVGQALMMIKLSKLPKCPILELEGSVSYLDASQGLVLGVAFESGKAALLGAVRALVASRATAIPTTVPPKVRRQLEAEPEAEEPVHRPAAKKPPEPSPSVPAEAASPTLSAEPAPAPAPAPDPEPSPVLPLDHRSQPILRMKKRTRGILLAMPEGPDRDALAAYLSQDGYGRVPCAHTLTDLLEQVERPGIHLILVDGGVAELQGLSLASLLRHRLGDEMPPVILAEAIVDAELVLGARETGVAQILVKPYDLDPDFLHMLEGHLGIG